MQDREYKRHQQRGGVDQVQGDHTPGKQTLAEQEGYDHLNATASQRAYGTNGMYASPGGLWTRGAVHGTQAIEQPGGASHDDRHREKKSSRKPEQRVERLIAIIDRHVKLVTKKLDGSSRGLDPKEAAAMRASLSDERESLLRLCSNVPSNSPLLLEALESAERAQRVITRLEAIVHAEAARSGIGEIAHASDEQRQDLAAASARKSPDGYCDTAPSRQEPCHLSEARRAELRAQIRFVVNEASSSWKAAIIDAKVVERFKQQEPSFEQQLGQLLFSLLFNVVGNVTKGLITKGIEKADAALGETQSFWGGTARAGGLAPSDKKLAQDMSGMIIDKATPIAQAKIVAGVTAHQLAEEAKQAAAVPNDSVSFLTSIETAPSKWSGSINANLSQLLDTDLEALHVALPPAETFSIPYFRKQIEDLLTRFKQQVLAVEWWHQTTPCQVITAAGTIRYALITPEEKTNKELHGEWKYVPVRTGKWSFVRWIDEDMRGMAMQRAMQHDGAAAAALLKSANDATFWSATALEELKQLGQDGQHRDGKN